MVEAKPQNPDSKRRKQKPAKKHHDLISLRNGCAYRLLKVLGQGSQATVIKAQRSTDKKYFAIKRTARNYVRTNNESLNSRRWQCIRSELQIMEELDSPYIVKYIEFINSQVDHFYYVQEICNGGNLESLLTKMKGGCLAENQAKRVLLQIIEGFTYLYEKKIIHRDCKLENILINFPDRDGGKEIPWEEIDLDKEKFEIKIADFGYARRLEHGQTSQSYFGTPLLMAPEVLFGKKYGHKRDVWALGAMYFQMITGKYIFGNDNCTMDELESAMLEGQWHFPEEIKFSLQGLEFMNRLLCFEEADRLDWPSIGSQAYLTTASTDYIPLKRVDFVSSDKTKGKQNYQFSDSHGSSPGSFGGDLEPSDDISDENVGAIPRGKRPNSFLSNNKTPLPVIAEEIFSADEITDVFEEGKLTVAHSNAGLVIDIYNVRKFSLSCKQVYENFQSENEITIQIKDGGNQSMLSPTKVQPRSRMQLLNQLADKKRPSYIEMKKQQEAESILLKETQAETGDNRDSLNLPLDTTFDQTSRPSGKLDDIDRSKRASKIITEKKVVGRKSGGCCCSTSEELTASTSSAKKDKKKKEKGCVLF